MAARLSGAIPESASGLTSVAISPRVCAIRPDAARHRASCRSSLKMSDKALREADAGRETGLYPAVKAHLEGLGFSVKGEICGCDVVALRGDDPPIIVVTEMKLSFTLELLLQAVDRMAIADEVWLAVRTSTRGRDRDSRVRKLCRLLGFGLLGVLPAAGRVDVLVEPGAYKPRADGRRRSRLLEEHRRRRGDTATGGSTRRPIMTAYRQRALACAAALQSGPQTVAALRATIPDAATILLRNVYGWFERERRGSYRLSAAGAKALSEWSVPRE